MGFTDTISQERDRATGESNSNPAEKPPINSRRTALAWMALAAACLAVVVLGWFALAGSSSDEAEIPSWRDVVDAEEIERQARFDGQARTYGGVQKPASDVELPSGRDVVDAEEIERQARLDGQARTSRG